LGALEIFEWSRRPLCFELLLLPQYRVIVGPLIEDLRRSSRSMGPQQERKKTTPKPLGALSPEPTAGARRT
ncbi:MAG: hypothetical protein WBN62_18435, partial [Thermoanaerobaculia bacterium]